MDMPRVHQKTESEEAMKPQEERAWAVYAPDNTLYMGPYYRMNEMPATAKDLGLPENYSVRIVPEEG